MAVRCNKCNGNKEILCLGNILKECDKCEGIGFTEDERKNPHSNKIIEYRNKAKDKRMHSNGGKETNPA